MSIISTKTPMLRILMDVLTSEDAQEVLDMETITDEGVIEFIRESENASCGIIRDIMSARAAKREAANKNRQEAKFLRTRFTDGSPVKREFGTEANLQAIRAAQGMATYANEDNRILESYRHLFDEKEVPTSYLLQSKFVVQVVSPNRDKNDAFAFDVPTSFQVYLYMHMIAFAVHTMKSKRRKGRRSPLVLGNSRIAGTRIGIAVQRAVYAWDIFAAKCGVQNAETLLRPFMLREAKSNNLKSARNHGRQSTEQKASQNMLMARFRGNAGSSQSGNAGAVLQEMCQVFISDLQRVVNNNGLYGEIDDFLECLTPFDVSREGIPNFVASLAQDSLTALRYDASKKVDLQPVLRRVSKARSGMKRNRDDSDAGEEVEEPVRIPPPTELVQNKDLTPAIKVLAGEGRKYFHVFHCKAEDIAEKYEAELDRSLSGKVNFIMCDPPYGSRKGGMRDNAEYDYLSPQTMRNCMAVFDDALVDGGHGIIFCSPLQFKEWFDLFDKYKRTDAGKQNHYSISKTPIYFIREPGTAGPNRLSYHHTNMVEMAFHFWKHTTGVNNQTRVRYETQGFMDSRYAPWTNVIENVMPVLQPESVRVPRTDENGNRRSGTRMLRPEQKSVWPLATLVGYFTLPGDTVLDLFAGSLSTTKACLVTGKPRMFVGCDSDPSCIEKAQLPMLEFFATALTRENDPIPCSAEVRRAADIVRRGIEQRRKKDRKTKEALWELPENVPPYQRFPEHIYRAIGVLLENEYFVNNYNRFPIDRIPERLRAQIDMLRVEDLRNMELLEKGLVVRDSKIKHNRAGKGLFATREFAPGDVVCEYYGTLVYKDLSTEKTGKLYGSGIMAVNADDFRTYSMNAGEVVVAGTGKINYYIVPARFCAARYINDARYVDGDAEKGKIGDGDRRDANVEMVTSTERRSNNRMSAKFITVVAKRNIAHGEELYADYGEVYWDEDNMEIEKQM